MITSGFLLRSEVQQYSPYLISEQGAYDTLYRDFLFAARDNGYFDSAKGFRKAGILQRSCAPETPRNVEALLKQLNVATSKYDVGCPDAFATPAQLTQAVLQFKSDGVTVVIPVDTGATELPNFTKIAQQQGFRPKYALADDGVVATTQQSQNAPDAANFDGSVAFTNMRYGEENSGFAADASTERCNKIMSSIGQPDVRKQKVGFGGIACNQVWMFVDAVSHTDVISRATLAGGLSRSGRLDRPYPDGPADFGQSAGAVGGQFWRTVQWHRDCGCWKVLDRAWKPNYR
jgi:hypothetical protein